MKPIVEACAAVIEKEGKFLITQRRADAPLGNCWEFPGGKIEPNESFDACVVREVQEELGIQVRPERHLESVWYDYPHARVHLHFILCVWVGGSPQTLECADLRWISPHEFPDFHFPPADVRVIQALRGQVLEGT